MERIAMDAMTPLRAMRRDEGFSLLEVLAAVLLLSVGALGLAGAISLSARQLVGSQDQLLASQRAAEAIETVFKARDNRVLTWSQIRNVNGGSGADGGIFLDGPRPVRDPGGDGIVNTADDGAVAEVLLPGPDGLLGTNDDEHRALFGFTREIEIRDINPTLRQIRVIVTYRSAQGVRSFVLTTLLSSYA
jgi:prepilin-type N-terminal cleavage/methylation domain-containing protein